MRCAAAARSSSGSLTRDPGLLVAINVGSPGANRELAQRRADAIAAFLQKNGIDIDNVSIVGFGSPRGTCSANSPVRAGHEEPGSAHRQPVPMEQAAIGAPGVPGEAARTPAPRRAQQQARRGDPGHGRYGRPPGSANPSVHGRATARRLDAPDHTKPRPPQLAPPGPPCCGSSRSCVTAVASPSTKAGSAAIATARHNSTGSDRITAPLPGSDRGRTTPALLGLLRRPSERR
jgi:hypothetical protein